MTSFPTRRGLFGAAAGLALAAPALATTPGWPSQNLRLVVPFTPGGSNDNFARPVAEDGVTVVLTPFTVVPGGRA